MYDADLSDEQIMLKTTVRDFCRREAPRDKIAAMTNNGETAHVDALYRKMADQGWLGIGVPESFGGEGGTFVEELLVVEELSYGRAPVGGHLTTSILVHAVAEFASDQQRETLFPAVVAGDVMSIAITEPDAGSDVSALRTRATERGVGWVLNGQKMFCTNINIAQWVIVVAKVGGQSDDRHAGMTLFLVPTDRPGITHNRVPTLGHVDTNAVFFDNVEVGPEDVFGKVGGAFSHLISLLNTERLILGAYSVGLARRALDDTIAYVNQREQFGKPVGKFQAVQHTIAEMAMKVYAGESLMLRVGRKVDAGVATGQEASIVKLYTSEAAKEVTLDGMQMMGGYGYMMEFDMQHYLRDAVVGTVFGGTSQIQKNLIAHQVGL
ncbi:acyl-CoA dehydrogenase family protein [Nocardioides sp.]|uniref:acyl-CoA dehydrogenase family protein n=1 Tax=Nocardioides sp. TaxID=35761 RepID=UPI0026144B4E|nr:acyl-CoA dehydrogenase family protein [Nocardioides sp.]MDI6912479.1 acyl-CoA dehydrogenase family protein [Nocardioides sp.]